MTPPTTPTTFETEAGPLREHGPAENHMVQHWSHRRGVSMGVESTQRPSPTALKVVVADDDGGVLRFVCGVLRAAGHKVVECSDGREATRQAIAEKVDIVITDLVMPEQEGIETVLELRRRRPELGIMAISGAFDGTMLEAAALLGADLTLGKPFTAGSLLEAVDRVASLRTKTKG